MLPPRSLLALTPLFACGSPDPSPRTPAGQAPQAETPASESAPTSPDEPAFGLYRLEKAHLRPQVLAAMEQAGQSPDSIRRDLEVLDPAEAWLVLDREAEPILVHTVEHPSLEPLTLTRHLEHFSLALPQQSDTEASCRAESAARIACDVTVEGEPLSIRFERARGGAVGMPTAGIYEVESEFEGYEEAVRRELREAGVTDHDADALLERVEEDRALAIIDGDIALLVSLSLILSGASGAISEPELERTVETATLDRQEDGFALTFHPDVPSLRCHTTDDGFRCESSRGDLRARRQP